jgi:hypothetical protein
MKKPLYFIFALLFAFALVSCPSEPDKDDGDDDKIVDEPLTLDQRLVNGRWFRIAWSYNQAERIYQFSNSYPDTDGYAFYASLYYDFNDSEFYSKNNIIYKRQYNHDQKLMDYRFVSTFTNNYIVENHQKGDLTYDRYSALHQAATHGDLITYNLFDGGTVSVYEGYLIRGTKYKDL